MANEAAAIYGRIIPTFTELGPPNRAIAGKLWTAQPCSDRWKGPAPFSGAGPARRKETGWRRSGDVDRAQLHLRRATMLKRW
jgi:hypothetical protein